MIGIGSRRSLPRGRSSGRHLRQPEVENFGVATPRHQDVRRLDVAMDNAFSVRRVQGVGNLGCQIEQQLNLQWLTQEAMLQRDAIEKLHRDEGAAFFFADVVNRADVGMVQRRCGFRFAPESFQRLTIVGQLFGQELKSNEAVKPYVLGLIDHSHPAAAQLLDDAVVRDGLPNHWAES